MALRPVEECLIKSVSASYIRNFDGIVDCEQIKLDLPCKEIVKVILAPTPKAKNSLGKE